MPIVEIPIDSKQFERFNDLFGQYEERLQKTPGFWQKVNKEFRDSTAAILAQNQAMKEFGATDPGKLRQVESGWRSIASFSGTILGNTMRITRQLLKWGTLLGGGLLGGSLWGLTHMAADVAGYRRQAMGLGMSVGSLRSFDVNFGRLGDPGSFLSSINQAISNPALQGPLYALGVNPNGSTEQVSVAMLKAMRQLALNTPRGELGLMSDAYGLGPFGGLNKLMILKAMSNGEFGGLLRGNAKDQSGLGLPPGVARKWQDFTTQMERARAEILKVFVTGLAPLEKPLERLSVAFSGFLSKVMSGPELKKGIDALASWLDTFSTKMASKQFQSAVDRLVSDTGTIAQAFHDLASDIRSVKHGYNWLTSPVKSKWFNPGALGSEARGAINGASLRGWLSFLDSKYKLPPGTMAAVAKTESDFNAQAVNAKTGAAGMFQYMPATARAQGVNPYDYVQEGNAAGAYLARLRAQFGSMEAAHAVYGGFGNEMRSLMSKYGKDWQAHMPRAMRNYVTATTPDSSIVVTARHKTGANAVLAAAGLAGVPQ